MSRSTCLYSAVFILAAVVALFASSMPAAHGASVTGPWTSATGQGDGPITNENTASPTVGDGTPNSATGEMFDSPFPTITLANSGDKIIFSGSVTLVGTVGTAGGPRTQFRFGLFKDDDGSTDDLGWIGYYMSNFSGGAGTPAGTLGRKPVGNTSAYLSTTGQSVLTSAQGNGVNFTDDTYTMSLTIERSGDEVLVSGTLTGAVNGFTQSLSGTDLTTSTSGTYAFDRLGFLLGANLGTDQAQFSNVDVSFIPEPASFTLCGIGSMLLIGRRRRRPAQCARKTPSCPQSRAVSGA